MLEVEVMLFLVAVCIYCYVITLGLRSKYDVAGHYSRFALRILEIMSQGFKCQIITIQLEHCLINNAQNAYCSIVIDKSYHSFVIILQTMLRMSNIYDVTE